MFFGNKDKRNSDLVFYLDLREHEREIVEIAVETRSEEAKALEAEHEAFWDALLVEGSDLG